MPSHNTYYVSRGLQWMYLLFKQTNFSIYFMIQFFTLLLPWHRPYVFVCFWHTHLKNVLPKPFYFSFNPKNYFLNWNIFPHTLSFNAYKNSLQHDVCLIVFPSISALSLSFNIWTCTCLFSPFSSDRKLHPVYSTGSAVVFSSCLHTHSPYYNVMWMWIYPPNIAVKITFLTLPIYWEHSLKLITLSM